MPPVRSSANLGEASSIYPAVQNLLLAARANGLAANVSTHVHGAVSDARITLEVEEDVRWLRAGRVATSAGISAGIDMSLALVSELFGETLADLTARQMEYDWNHR